MPALMALLSAGCAGPGHAPAGATPAGAEVVVIVKFQSRFDAAEIKRRYPQRMPEFRKLAGLVQKYYLYDEQANEWAGVYFWDSMESVQEYLASDLRKSIPSAYGVVGTPRVEVMQLVDVLR